MPVDEPAHLRHARRGRRGRDPGTVPAGRRFGHVWTDRSRFVTVVRDGLAAGAVAALPSGLPSTLHALLTGRDPLEATTAAGSILLSREERTPVLVAAAVPVHLAALARLGRRPRPDARVARPSRAGSPPGSRSRPSTSASSAADSHASARCRCCRSSPTTPPTGPSPPRCCDGDGPRELELGETAVGELLLDHRRRAGAVEIARDARSSRPQPTASSGSRRSGTRPRR